MPNPNCPDCHGSGVVVAGDLLGRPCARPCALCGAYESEVNPYLRPLLERMPEEWTPGTELGAWAHLDELWQSGHIECKIEPVLNKWGEPCGTRHYYRRKEIAHEGDTA